MRRMTQLLFVFTAIATVVFCGEAQAQQKRMVGYIESFADPSTVDYDNLTHVCFSFVEPDGNGWTKSLNSNELGNLWNLVQLAHAKDVKVLLAVGGWISDDRSVRERAWKFADDQNISQIRNFVGQITQVVDGFGLDGVDLDWEFPKSKSAWNLVVAEFKKEIKDERGKLLTAAVAASEFKWQSNDANYTGAAQVGVTSDLDFISIMGYDWWDTGESYVKDTDITKAWSAWWYWSETRGVPLAKLNMGITVEPINGHRISTLDHIDKAEQVNYMGMGGMMVWSLNRATDPNLVSLVNAEWNPPPSGVVPYAEGQAYSTGSVVTFGGNRYQAIRDTFAGIDPTSSWFWLAL